MYYVELKLDPDDVLANEWLLVATEHRVQRGNKEAGGCL